MKQFDLLLLTTSFPFGNGETFLKYELPALSRQFRQIYFFPISPLGKLQSIPTNCTILNSSPVQESALALISSCMRLRVWRQLLSIAPFSLGAAIHAIKVSARFDSRASAICQKIHRQVEKQNLDPAKTLFYAYWCMEHAFSLCLLKSRIELKAISRLHGYDIFKEVHAYSFLPFRREIHDNLDTLIPISKKGAKYLVNKNVRLTAKIQVMRLGVPEPSFRVSGRNPVLVSCSSLIPLKQVEVIAATLNQISTKYQIEWHHFGDGPLMAKIESLVRGNPTFHLHGYLPTEEILAAYQELTPLCFINFSQSEGIPVSIMEAFSVGIPAIAPSIGGIDEIVDNSNGILLSKDATQEDLYRSVESFLRMSDCELESKRSNAIAKWEKSFNAATNFEFNLPLIFQSSEGEAEFYTSTSQS